MSDQKCILRLMTEADLDAVTAIERDCFARPWSREHFMSEILSDRALAVVAEAAGRIAGYLCLTVLFEEAEILDVAVAPEFRRSGIGNALIESAITESFSRGASVLRLEVRATSRPAIAMYEKFEFNQYGLRRAYYENGIDAVLMEKRLDRP